MSIPVVLVWGQRDSLGRVGWTARRCSRCGRAQAFECHRRTRAHHLYFVEYKAEDVGHIVVCDVCDGADALGTKEEPRVDTGWEPRQGLEALVKGTDPSLLPIEPRTSLSEAEVLAILRVADERGKALGKDVTAPFLVGAIPGGILIAAVMAALSAVGFLPRSADTFGWAFLGLLLGGLAAGIFMAVRVGHRTAQQAMWAAFDRAAQRHRVQRSTLRAAIGKSPIRLAHAERALRAGAGARGTGQTGG